jgi:hypothetical protein
MQGQVGQGASQIFWLFLLSPNAILQLRTSYTAVTRVKNNSGITWDEERGANINLQTECTWNEIIKVCDIDPSQLALR